MPRWTASAIGVLAEAADLSGQDQVQIGSPLLDGLTGPAVDEVETYVFESRAARRGDSRRDVIRFVQPAEHPQTASI